MRLQVQAIVVGSMPSLQAAFDATRAVPIIMAGAADDPVGSGFIASLARPGGNVTRRGNSAPGR